jgi:hypothetical protein
MSTVRRVNMNALHRFTGEDVFLKDKLEAAAG